MRLVLLSAVLLGQLASASIVGTWQSDCQAGDGEANSYAPLDTFYQDGSAKLVVRGYGLPDCQGDVTVEVIFYCRYQVGKDVLTIPTAKELDLTCYSNGGAWVWYDLAAVEGDTLHFGSESGNSPETRPLTLGNVVYRRVPGR